MKINATDPGHLVALSSSALLSVIVSVARPVLKNKNAKQKVVIFYGHTLNGNLKVFYDYLNKRNDYRAYFLVLDKNYLKRLGKSFENTKNLLSSSSFKDMKIVGGADAFITSHGLHFFSIIRALTDIKFVDVWHAVSYKGFSKKSFKSLRLHDAVWVSSQDMKDLYEKRYGFDSGKVVVTGYARTDLLVSRALSKTKILKKYSIPHAKKYILIAPTWQQDEKGRSLIPFGLSEKKFFLELDDLAKKNSAVIIFRTHLNSGDAVKVSGLERTLFMPYSKYEVVEEFLYIADILVTDWSSTGIDYLPLRRPTIFLDVPAPFKYGFNLGPEHRYGDIAGDFTALKRHLEKNLNKPEEFLKSHGSNMDTTTAVAYGETLDGRSVSRYFTELSKLTKNRDA